MAAAIVRHAGYQRVWKLLILIAMVRLRTETDWGRWMSSNEDFFAERKAAAVFKHAILSRYPVVFASKAGVGVRDHRVTFLDGYAGRGRYEKGEPGSPLLLVESAEKVEAFRKVRGVFVERDPDNFANLSQVL